MYSDTAVLTVVTTPIAGPLLLGFSFIWGLYGVLSVQVYLYYISFPKDTWPVKALVCSIYALETSQTIIVTRDAFNTFAINYGDVAVLNSMQLEWFAVPLCSGIVSATVQLYYAYRVSIISGSRLLGLGISAIALLEGSAAIVEGVKSFQIGNFTDLVAESFVSCSIWLAGSASCDVIIAACMTYLLLKKKTHIRSTQVLITRLVRLIIETGMLTAFTATLDLILFIGFPHSAYHACVAMALSKLYSNSLLVLFNSRIRIAGGRNDISDDLYDTAAAASQFASRPNQAGTPGRSTFRWVQSPRSAVTRSSFGGVHVQEQRWISSNPELIELQDQPEFSTTKTIILGPEV